MDPSRLCSWDAVLADIFLEHSFILAECSRRKDSWGCWLPTGVRVGRYELPLLMASFSCGWGCGNLGEHSSDWIAKIVSRWENLDIFDRQDPMIYIIIMDLACHHFLLDVADHWNHCLVRDSGCVSCMIVNIFRVIEVEILEIILGSDGQRLALRRLATLMETLLSSCCGRDTSSFRRRAR